MQKEKEQSFRIALKKIICFTLFLQFQNRFVSHFKNNACLKHIFNSNYYNPSVAQLALISVALAMEKNGDVAVQPERPWPRISTPNDSLSLKILASNEFSKQKPGPFLP